MELGADGVCSPLSISLGFCGLVNCLQPALAQRIEGDDGNAAPARLLQVVQHARAVAADILSEEEDRIGVLAKSSSVTVPTGTPMLSGSATDVVSWHMLEQSGRLLVPYRRASSWYMYAASRPARPEA